MNHPPVLLLKGERQAHLESLHLLETGLDVSRDNELVFTSKSGPSDVLNVFCVRTERIKKTLRPADVVSISSPAWSNDGTRIVFSGIDWRGYQDIYTIDVGSEKVTAITNDFYSDKDPEFSPDDQKIVFSSDRNEDGENGAFNLYFYDFQDSSLHQKTFGNFRDTSPDWSSYDKDRIVFTSDRNGVFNLWLLKVPSSAGGDQAQLRQLTNNLAGALDGRWAGQDDRDLVFTVFEKYQFQIHHLKDADSLGLNDSIPVGEPVEKPGWKRPSILSDFGKKSPRYRKKFSLDIAQTAIAYDGVFGFLGGAQLSVSDILGNEYYNVLIFNTAETSSQLMERTNVAITKIDLSRRVNLGYGLFHFAGDYYTYEQGFLFRRRFGGQLAFSYPLTVFNRLELTTSLWRSQRKSYFNEDILHALLFSNSASYVFDNSIWGSVGPIDGTAIRFSLGHSFDLLSSQAYNNTFLVDFRKYFRTSIRTLYAFRLMTRLNSGEDLFRFFVGGSWGLRGYPRTGVSGTKFFLINNEFRFPFADQFSLRFRTFDLGLTPVRGAFFLDIGNAWTQKLDKVQGSFGIGLRGRLLGAFVIRLDIGKTTDFTQLSDHLFTQLFFGWDY